MDAMNWVEYQKWLDEAYKQMSKQPGGHLRRMILRSEDAPGNVVRPTRKDWSFDKLMEEMGRESDGLG